MTIIKLLLTFAVLCLSINATESYATTIVNPKEIEKVYYRIYVSGVPVGKVWLWWESNAQYYKMTGTLKTTGMVRLFSKRIWYAELTGKRMNNGYLPIHYHATATYPRKKKSTNISYEKGVMQEVVNEPPVEKILDTEQKLTAVDPITGLVQMLLFARDSQAVQSIFSARVYDGKRLMQVNALPSEAKDCISPCQRYRFSRQLLFGYDEEDLAEYAKGDPELVADYNPTQSHFPLSVKINARIGTIAITRIQEEK
jgi:Protein of unknown function (DUF3108)